MKNITKSLIALFAIMAFSCTQDDVQDRPVIIGTDVPVLTAPQADQIYVFAPENASLLAERFTWSPASFDANVEIVYAVQMDLKGGDFSAAQTLGSVIAQNQVAVTIEVMNNAALKLKATPFVENNFDIRVVATTGVSTTIISAVTPIVITPYTTEAPKLWIPGDYQAASGYGANWKPEEAPILIAEAYGKTAFEGYVYFDASGEFKMTPQPDFNPIAYGMGATPGTISATGGNIAISTAGYYLMTADTKADILSYSATATRWAVTGSGTSVGWPPNNSDGTAGNDIDMTYNKTTKLWTVETTLSDGEIKFRANDAWSLNYGKGESDGVLVINGGNIASTTGVYIITADFSNPRNYKYSVIKK